MKTESKITLWLLFASPIFGELFSGSTPLPHFINPIVLLIFLMLYGCGALLIREARARWNLQWSVLFLAAAYGIIEEGLMVKSFFNPGHNDLNALAQYGLYLDTQWVWSIMLTLFHGTMSTLVPIAIADLLWPEAKQTPLLKKRGLLLSIGSLALVTLFGMLWWGPEENGEMTPYYPHPLLLLGSAAITAALIWLAYRFRGSRIATKRPLLLPAWAFGVIGFGFQLFNVLLPFALADGGVDARWAIFYQVVLTFLLLLFVFLQLGHQALKRRHIFALVFGSTLLWVLLTSLGGSLGTLLVGGGLLLWLGLKRRSLVGDDQKAKQQLVESRQIHS